MDVRKNLKELIDKYTELADHYAEQYILGPKNESEKNKRLESKYNRMLIETVGLYIKEVHDKKNS